MPQAKTRAFLSFTVLLLRLNGWTSESTNNSGSHFSHCDLRLIVDDPALVLVLAGHHTGDHAALRVPQRTLGAVLVGFTVLQRGANPAGIALQHEVRGVVLEHVENGRVR